MTESDNFRWTGEEKTSKCGCEWRELVRIDGQYPEPIWIGKTTCVRHIEKMGERVKELQEKGVLPK